MIPCIDTRLSDYKHLFEKLPFIQLKWVSEVANLEKSGDSFLIATKIDLIKAASDQDFFCLLIAKNNYEESLKQLPPNTLLFHNCQDAVSWLQNHPKLALSLDEEISKGAEYIKKGEIVAFPTETVYGLGADALNPKAVLKIFKTKKRPLSNPLIVHINDQDQLKDLVLSIPEKARILMDAFWPGPLTIVLPKSHKVPDIVTANNSTVAIRMPRNDFALKFIRQSKTPIAAPSANAFGYTSPTTAAHVKMQLQNAPALIIDAGACNIGVESTVISFVDKNPRLLRPGGISAQSMERLIGAIEQNKAVPQKNFHSPGQMLCHYAPATPLYICDQISSQERSNAQTGFLLLKPVPDKIEGPVEILSSKGDLDEAAVNLFAALYRLDKLNLQKIITHLFPEQGIGTAINDRLKKAAAGSQK